MANVENINRLIEHLKADAGKHFLMSGYAQYLPHVELGVTDYGRDRPYKYVECGTAFCLAGWANTFALAENGVSYKESHRLIEEMCDVEQAGRWLGIVSGHYDLFEMVQADMSLSMFDSLPEPVRLAAGIRVLEILRDEDRVDWDEAIEFAKRATGTAADL